MVSLKKESYTREYTPEHLMDEEEAVRKFCPPRESTVIADSAEIQVEKEHGITATTNEDSSPQTKSAISSMKIFWIVILIMCIVAFLACTVSGAKYLMDYFSTGNPKSLTSAFLFAVCGTSLTFTPLLVKRLFDCRRW